MKKTLLISTSLGLILLTSVWLIKRDRSVKTDRSLSLTQVTASIGGQDDPSARARFRWLRLHDPVTGRIPANIRRAELKFSSTLPSKEELAPVDQLSKNVALDWFARGPFNVGGRTRALGVDVTDEDVILAGGASGAIWRSENGGASWTNTTAPDALHSITSLVQDTRFGHTNVWYYSTGETLGSSNRFGFTGDGIYRSNDGGQSWDQLPSTATGLPQFLDQPFDLNWNLAIDASNVLLDEVYAATFSGINRSIDGGGNWSNVLGGFDFDTGSLYTDVAITSEGVVYAALSEATLTGSSSPNQGMWRSSDGVNWTNITPAGWPTVYNRTVIGIAPSNEDVVYFLANTPGSGFQTSDSPVGDDANSLWKYDDSDGSWTDLSTNLPGFGNPVGDFNSQTSYDLLVSVKPDNENVVFVGGISLFRSTDGFASTSNTTWIGGYAPVNNLSQYPNHHPDLHAQVYLPSNPNVVLSGHDGGLSKTTNILADSVGWTSQNNGYVTSQFYTIAIDPTSSGSNLIMGGMQDNGVFLTTSNSFTQSWRLMATGDGSFCSLEPGGNAGLLSTQMGRTFRVTLNSSGQITAFGRVDPTGGEGYLFINPFAVDPNNVEILYMAGGDRLWRNSDLSGIPLNGSEETTSTNWSQLTGTIVNETTISAVAVSTSPANRVYYGTTNGEVYRVDAANIGNPTSSDLWTNKGLPEGFVGSIAVDPNDGDNALLVFSNYRIPSLFYTTDGGNTWTDVSGNLEENPNGSGSGPSARWASILPVNGSTYYFVATSTGLYSTTTLNGSSTVWALEGASTIGNVLVDMVVTRPSDGRVVAATHGQGVYSSTVTVTGVGNEPIGVPESYALHPNFPNPFNPTTVISYTLPRAHAGQKVRLQIYNSRGQQVRTLIEQEQQSGEYQVEWDGTDDLGSQVASGLYVYRLRAGEFVESRKMVLVR